MSQDVFKAPKAKRLNQRRDSELSWSPAKKRKIKEKFLNFCNIVLAYTHYESVEQEDLRASHNTSPLDSGSSAAESFTSESTSSSFTEDEFHVQQDGRSHSNHRGLDHDERRMPGSHMEGTTSDEDSYELITCYCMKPFAGRPMIECSKCLTWVHLSCAKIRKTNIPDEFTCQMCKDSKMKKRKSSRVRSEKKFLSA